VREGWGLWLSQEGMRALSQFVTGLSPSPFGRIEEKDSSVTA